MRQALALFPLFALLALSGCTESGGDRDRARAGGGSSPVGQRKVGVIMPDTTSSKRWEQQDAKYLRQAFDAAGVPVDIQNAQGDKARFVRLAQDMIAAGASVLVITNLDSPSGKAALDKARNAGVSTIDYDRLTLNGHADYYVSFDNRRVGELQALELMRCLRAKAAENPVIAELNGSPTDNNAALFKEGYDSILQPMYDQARYTKGPDQWVPDWKETEAAALFEQMLSQQPRIRGVLAANDGIANATIAVLKKNGLNGKVPVTGQDATAQGLRNILTGDQCMTVFKDTKPQAKRAAELAIALYKGEKPTTTDQTKDFESGDYVPFVKLTPVAITKATINRVLDTGYVSRREVCAGSYAKLCDRAGI